MRDATIEQGLGRSVHAVIAAFCAVIAGAAVASAFFGGGAHASSSAKLSFHQSVESARFSVANLELLAKGTNYSKVCWRLTRSGADAGRWCAARRTSTGPWRISGAKRKGARIHIVGENATLALDPTAVGLPPGLYRWRFTADSCAAVPTGATGEEDCSVSFPTPRGQKIRIRTVVPAGCRVRGRAQVTAGPRHKQIALTFDDGPSQLTPKFLRTLKHLDVPATFFMLGQQVRGHESLLKQMLGDGHELANHSFDHANLGGGGPAATSEIVRTNRLIKRASGFRPCLMRPPYGSTGSDLVRRIRAQRMTSVLWDVDPQDWRLPGAGTVDRAIRAHTHGGSIIIEHDGGGPRGQTLAAIPHYVRALRARGYRFVTVSRLLGYRTTYRLDR